MPKNTPNDLKVILVGAGLIILVVTASFWQSFFTKEETVEDVAEKASDAIQTQFLSPEEAKHFIDSENAAILDFRSDADFHDEHMIGARNVSLETLPNFVEDTAASSKIGQSLLLVGYEDMSFIPDQAGQYLESELDKTAVFALTGGFESWKEKSYPTVRAGDPTDPADQTKITYIKPAAALAKIANDSTFFILDVRDPSTYKQDYIDASVNIPLHRLEARREDIPRSRPILVYGENALESFQAGVRLFDMGFFQTETLNGAYTNLISSAETPEE